MDINDIKQTLKVFGSQLESCAQEKLELSFAEIGLASYNLNLALSALHLLKGTINATEFYALKNELSCLIELSKDIKKDMSGRHKRIEQAIIDISKERFNGELWKEVLRRSRALKAE